MDKYITLMIIPQRQKGVRTFKIPIIAYRTGAIIAMLLLVILMIFGFDYWKVLQQVHENHHLSLENRQLKEQIQLFQMKINTISEDLKRIEFFEKKLRTITGLDATDDSTRANHREVLEKINNPEFLQNNQTYIELKNLYEKKIATQLGMQSGYHYTKEFSLLAKSSLALAGQYAQFDFQVGELKTIVHALEISINSLDQNLLDKEAFLRSTPTLMPARGWITSYYGPRLSPYSGRVKMHEGLDIGANIGTPVLSPADGIVTFSGSKPGFGNFIQIDHGYGMETIYAHAQSLNVSKGQIIKRGYLIAKVGNTGYSTGPHLHYEIRANGIPVDPLYYILD